MKRTILSLVMIMIAGFMFGRTFHLKNGTTVEGRITFKSDTAIIVEDRSGNSVMVPISSLKDDSQYNLSIELASETDSSKTSSDSVLKAFSLYLSVGSTALVSGSLYDTLRSGLNPTPNTISDLICGAGLDWYFFNIFGISFGCDFINNIRANTLSISYSQNLQGLFLLRLPFYQSQNTVWFFRAFAGPSYTFYGLSDDFKKLLQTAANQSGYTFIFYEGPATGVGLRGGLGVGVQHSIIGYGLDLVIQNNSVQYPGALKKIEWLEVGLVTRMNFDF